MGLVNFMANIGEKSLFLEFFGDSPKFRVIDFMLEHRLEDFTKTEIAKGAGVSWATLFNYWKELEQQKIVKVTRTIGRVRLFQLDENTPVVQVLKNAEGKLIAQAAEMVEEKVTVRARAKK